jgi:ferrous iron transport protein B
MSDKKTTKKELEVVLAERRYEAISKVLEKSLKKGKRKLTFSDVLDRFFLNKYLGIPIFLVIMWAVFQFTFMASEPFMVMLERGFGELGGLAGAATTPLASLWADGICGGLGFVLVFIFPIFFLFLALSILELSGYLPRAAFVMDRAMHKVGLCGRSFVPMLMGFGCNVPAIMATRSIEDRKDRLLTILVNPLMSCSARLPVYVLIAGALFPDYAGTAVFSMYILGIVLAVLMALLFRKIIPALKGKPGPFVMELPPYQMPTAKSVGILTWERGFVFIKKAGTILFLGALLLWFLSSFPWGAGVESSYAASLGRTFQPIFAPLGFSWIAVTALIFGFLAKEIVVGTFGIIFAIEGEEAIQAAVAGHMTPVTGLAFMAFTLIYIPCLATIGIVKQETGSWKWVGFLVLYGLILAYAVAAIIVGIGSLL